MEISPLEILKFKGPFDRNMTQEITLDNKTERERFCFKIKSNAPKNRLVVSPHIGIIEPGQSIINKVTLSRQILTSGNPPPSYSILVQTIPVGSDVGNIKEVWNVQGHSGEASQKIRTTRLECVYEGEGKDGLIRRPYRRVTLPGKVAPLILDGGNANALLNKGLLFEERPASLTVSGQAAVAAGVENKKKFRFQPVIQPPNTATVVFPSTGSDNLGELEIINNKPATKPGDTNNNSHSNQKEEEGGFDWNTGKSIPANPSTTAATHAAAAPASTQDGRGNTATADAWAVQPTPASSAEDNLWDNLRADNGRTAAASAAPAPGVGNVNDGWNEPHQPHQVAAGNMNGVWNEQNTQQQQAQQAPVGNQDGGWGDLQNAAADAQQPGMVGGAGNAPDAWDPNQPEGQYDDRYPEGHYPAPPIAGVDDHIKTMFAVALAAVGVFLFGLILGKAGLW